MLPMVSPAPPPLSGLLAAPNARTKTITNLNIQTEDAHTGNRVFSLNKNLPKAPPKKGRKYTNPRRYHCCFRRR